MCRSCLDVVQEREDGLPGVNIYQKLLQGQGSNIFMSDHAEDRATGTQAKVAEIFSSAPDVKPVSDTSQLTCGPEAVRVLNCVAALNYQEARCASLLVALRKCCESKVSFHNATASPL